jgi:hypothetical protein
VTLEQLQDMIASQALAIEAATQGIVWYHTGRVKKGPKGDGFYVPPPQTSIGLTKIAMVSSFASQAPGRENDCKENI